MPKQKIILLDEQEIRALNQIAQAHLETVQAVAYKNTLPYPAAQYAQFPAFGLFEAHDSPFVRVLYQNAVKGMERAVRLMIVQNFLNAGSITVAQAKDLLIGEVGGHHVDDGLCLIVPENDNA